MGETGGQHDDPEPTAWGRRLAALAVLVLPPAVLVAVYTAPRPVKQSLVLTAGDPTVVGLWASHYVHFAESHLVGNLVSYAALVPTCYALCAFAGRRRRFWGAFVALLVGYPPLLSASDLLLGQPGISYGFSGVAMAFFGFLGVALFTFLADRWVGVTLDHAPAVFFGGASLIAFVALPPSRRAFTAGIAAALVALGYVVSWYLALPSGALRRSFATPGATELPAFALCLFVATAFAGFSGDPIRDGVLVNVYVHFVGYCSGFVLPYAVIRLRPTRGALGEENESTESPDRVSETLSTEGQV